MTTPPEIKTHAPGCGGDAGTSTVVGHSTTVTRCLGCGAIAAVRHMGERRPTRPRRVR